MRGWSVASLRDLLAGKPWRRRTTTAKPDGADQSTVWKQDARWIGDRWWAGAWSEDWIGGTYAVFLARRTAARPATGERGRES